MAKLTVNTAGWNAGKNYYAKMVQTADLTFDTDIAKLFMRDGLLLAEITRSMKENGYDTSQPTVTWKGHDNIVVDGHTRVLAAKAAGLLEIPVEEKEFEDKEAAILYTFERQAVRRNLSGAEIMNAASLLGGRKARDGKGRAAKIWATRLGVSEAHIYQAKKVAEEAPPEDVEAIKAGETTIKAVYNKITAKPEAVPKEKAPPKAESVSVTPQAETSRPQPHDFSWRYLVRSSQQGINNAINLFQAIKNLSPQEKEESAIPLLLKEALENLKKLEELLRTE